MPQPTRLLLPIAISCLLAACAQPVRPTAPDPASAPPVQAASATTHYGGANSTATTAVVAVAAPPGLSAEKRAAFVAEATKLSGMSADEVNAWLDQA
jgi:hypothetical protein